MPNKVRFKLVPAPVCFSRRDEKLEISITAHRGAHTNKVLAVGTLLWSWWGYWYGRNGRCVWSSDSLALRVYSVCLGSLYKNKLCTSQRADLHPANRIWGRNKAYGGLPFRLVCMTPSCNIPNMMLVQAGHCSRRKPFWGYQDVPPMCRRVYDIKLPITSLLKKWTSPGGDMHVVAASKTAFGGPLRHWNAPRELAQTWMYATGGPLSFAATILSDSLALPHTTLPRHLNYIVTSS